ncbi:MAG: hypothetical protein ABFS14_08655 [Gemmatimonadota bacterium]
MALSKRRIIRDGLVAGLIGAGSVALWFLVIDLLAGRAFFTPAVLGSAVFWALRDPAEVIVSLQPVLAYTAVHVLAFAIVGAAASFMIAEVERDPGVVWLLIELFVVFEIGFYGAVALAFTPLLAELAWINVAVGNLIAAGVMGMYFWRTRSALRALGAGDPTATPATRSAP